MSILFGVRAADGESVTESQLRRLAQATSPYAPDGTSVLVRENVGMGFQPYYTHERSRIVSEPLVAEQGDMLSFDGRLDNHEDLCSELELPLKAASDYEILLAAFDKWGEDCFSRLIGDWALALWINSDRALYLGRDHAGTRTLYYERAQGRVRWGTYLDTFFVDSPGREIAETYAASYLAGFPVGELTPFEGVRAVPPAHYVRIEGERILKKQYWTCWRGRDEIRYRSDDEYREHFLSLFKVSVKRRGESGAPVIAQLSGGMDSSSIVCVSDALRKDAGAGSDDLIDTISIFDDSEPGWDERPFFTAVERVRGKNGTHFEASFTDRTFSPPTRANVHLWPGADSGFLLQEEALSRLLNGKGIRSVLSGLGGDELLGGVPTGIPELADLLVQARFGALCSQAFQWCLPTRTPLLHEVIGTSTATWTAYFGLRRRPAAVPEWVSNRLREILRARRLSCPGAIDRLRLLPSRIFAGEAWESILDSLPHLQPGLLCRYEFRYPYLDRELVDFLLAIPRTQLVRPGRRRYMMRNAMKGIVPDEVLERRRKASVQRSPIVAFRRHQQTLRDLFLSPRVCERGFVDLAKVQAALERVWSSNTAAGWPSLLRVINLELWLRGDAQEGVKCA